MKTVFCDRCGRIARIDRNLLVAFTQDTEKGETQRFDYRFDLCDQCGQEIVQDIQMRIVQRLTPKDGDGE